jgi:hypothetical protein
MSEAKGRLSSFMVEGIPVERWKLYLLRFLLLFLLPAVAAAFELSKITAVRVIVEGFLFALTMSAVTLWTERLKISD